jgi:POT family proton-dependent oligopeptide transporter
MALGCIILGLSFLVLMAGTQGMGEAQRISCCWLVLCIFVCTIGELYLSPIGLSLVSKVAPVRLVSMTMGIWFLSSFLGNYLSGYLGTYYEVFSKDQFFLMLALFALGAGIAMFALKKPLKKAIGEEV